MKGIFIAYDQAYNMDIADAMEKIGVRGFTMWQDIAGRGGVDGEPHLGNHAWPTMNNALLTFVPDDKVKLIRELANAVGGDVKIINDKKSKSIPRTPVTVLSRWFLKNSYQHRQNKPTLLRDLPDVIMFDGDEYWTSGKLAFSDKESNYR